MWFLRLEGKKIRDTHIFYKAAYHNDIYNRENSKTIGKE